MRTVAGSGIGGSRGAPPQGSRFFRFDIQMFRNVAASGVGAPLRAGRPPTGNPGSATERPPEYRLRSKVTEQERKQNIGEAEVRDL